MAQTSDRVSSIAAKYANFSIVHLAAATSSSDKRNELIADIRTLAASALRQDEHRGFRGVITRLLSRKS